MKRFIAAVSFAAVAASALALEPRLPYEQIEIDRALPNVPEKSIAVRTSALGMPYEQTAVDRTLPNIEPRRPLSGAASGGTRSERETATEVSAAPVWANDPHFVAPPL